MNNQLPVPTRGQFADFMAFMRRFSHSKAAEPAWPLFATLQSDERENLNAR